eukprot:NODE_214_length_12495_cov_0.543078.p6 type:complete len:231 gc:universal NODE_214_length_12495_cov_0.543078:5149-4457(-)
MKLRSEKAREKEIFEDVLKNVQKQISDDSLKTNRCKSRQSKLRKLKLTTNSFKYKTKPKINTKKLRSTVSKNLGLKSLSNIQKNNKLNSQKLQGLRQTISNRLITKKLDYPEYTQPHLLNLKLFLDFYVKLNFLSFAIKPEIREFVCLNCNSLKKRQNLDKNQRCKVKCTDKNWDSIPECIKLLDNSEKQSLRILKLYAKHKFPNNICMLDIMELLICLSTGKFGKLVQD